MQSKSLLIAIAAFAVTTTGVHAYGNTTFLKRAELSEEQRSAILEAKELREKGDITAARDALVEAGIDEQVLHSLRTAVHKSHSAIDEAVEVGDYEAFLKAISGTPLEDVVTTELDFELFQEAHQLKNDGELEEARALFDQLGITPHTHKAHKATHGAHNWSKLTDEQREALSVAKRANDKAAVRAIIDEAGI